MRTTPGRTALSRWHTGRSIKQFGWTNPVLIDEKGEIIAGHGRVMAAEMLKMDSVPVIVLSGLTDEQKKAYRLADNRLPMNAGWMKICCGWSCRT